jgi:PST family polysaccharide transporter
LLGKQWADSAAIFQPLAIAGLLQVVNGSMVCLFVSQGRTGELARLSIFGAIICVAGFVIGLPYGPIGVATAYALSECLITPLGWWYVARRGPVGARDVIRVILPQIASGVVSALALLAFRKLQAPPLMLLSGGLVLSYAASALTMCLSSSGRETLRNTWDAGRRILAHITPTGRK